MSFVSKLYFKAAEYAFAIPKCFGNFQTEINGVDDLDDFLAISFIPYNRITPLLIFSRAFLNSSLPPNFVMRPNALSEPRADFSEDTDEERAKIAKKEATSLSLLLPILFKNCSTIQFVNRLCFNVHEHRRYFQYSKDDSVEIISVITNDCLLHLLDTTKYFSRSLESLKVAFPISPAILARFTSLRELVLGEATSVWPPPEADPHCNNHEFMWNNNLGETAAAEREKQREAKARLFRQLPPAFSAEDITLLANTIGPRLETFKISLRFLQTPPGSTKHFSYPNIAVLNGDESQSNNDAADDATFDNNEDYQPHIALLRAFQEGKFHRVKSLGVRRIDIPCFGKRFFSLLASSAAFPNLRELDVSQSHRLLQSDFAACCCCCPPSVLPENYFFFVEQLDSLDISNCAGIGFATNWRVLSKTLCNFTHLRKLVMSQYVDDDCTFVPALEEILPRMPFLEVLRLGQMNAPDLTRTFKDSLFSVKETLRELDLNLNADLDDSFAKFVSECTNLEYLNLAYCRNISDGSVVDNDQSTKSGMEVLLKSLKKLRCLDMRTFDDESGNTLSVGRTLNHLLLEKYPLPQLQVLKMSLNKKFVHNQGEIDGTLLEKIVLRLPTLRCLLLAGSTEKINAEKTASNLVRRGALTVCRLESDCPAHSVTEETSTDEDDDSN